jgi:uncharacterized membrane protein
MVCCRLVLPDNRIWFQVQKVYPYYLSFYKDYYGIIHAKYTLKKKFVKPVFQMEEPMSIILQVIHDLLYVHPPHTLLVHFPIALTSAALFFILLALWKKSDLLEQVAFADISLAAVSTIVAAIVGIHDNTVFYHGLAPNHIVKIILATILFLVTTTVAFARWRNPKIFHGRLKVYYVSAYFVSFAIVAVLGFLGGVIVYGF